MNKSIDAQVNCPYYLREDGKLVDCAGVVKGTDTTVKFASKRAKEDFMAKHCVLCTGGGCELAEYFNKKYDWRP